MAEIDFDHETDILVVGYGFAGAAAAVEAAEAGAQVLIVEKMPDPGGISICSAGSARSAKDADAAFDYLKQTNAGRTPDDVLRVLADGMAGIEEYMKWLTGSLGLSVSSNLSRVRAGANYPMPGWDTFYHTLVDEIPGFDAEAAYPQVSGLAGGRRLFHVLEQAIAARDIEIWLESPVSRLLSRGEAGEGEVLGVEVAREGKQVRVRASKGVVLACGGFECDEETKRQFWQMQPVLPVMGRQNTGDGLRMAQSMGARLWHMWHFHGSYGFSPPEDEFPYGIRMKRLPDWVPGEDETSRAQMSWILVDGGGKRFMNEMPPYTQDISARTFEMFDSTIQDFPRIPAHMICDEAGLAMYGLGDVCYNERGLDYPWSDDNQAEVQSGIIKKASDVGELAQIMGADEKILEATLDRWNASCDTESDTEFGRMPGSFTPVRTPPYYTAPIWPLVSNTQGGPVHNARQQIMNVDGGPITRLYAAGELGSSFGHLYMSGSNITECFVTGRVAARDAAGLEDWS